MTYYLYPQTRIRQLNATHSILVQDSKKAVARLSGYPTLEAAQQDADRLAPLLNNGQLTLDQLKAQRTRIHRGLTQLQWAQKLGVHRNSIYQGAKYQGITWQEWVEAKLPMDKRLSNGSTETFQIP